MMTDSRTYRWFISFSLQCGIIILPHSAIRRSTNDTNETKSNSKYVCYILFGPILLLNYAHNKRLKAHMSRTIFLVDRLFFRIQARKQKPKMNFLLSSLI